jgi:hypothetical protein
MKSEEGKEKEEGGEQEGVDAKTVRGLAGEGRGAGSTVTVSTEK